MESRIDSTRPASTGAENFNPKNLSDLTAVPAEFDYKPKKMTSREAVMVSAKLALIAGLVLAVLWLAHVMFDK